MIEWNVCVSVYDAKHIFDHINHLVLVFNVIKIVHLLVQLWIHIFMNINYHESNHQQSTMTKITSNYLSLLK